MVVVASPKQWSRTHCPRMVPNDGPKLWSQTCMVPNCGVPNTHTPKRWSPNETNTYRHKGGPNMHGPKRYGPKHLVPNTHGPEPWSQTCMVPNCGSQTAHDPKQKRWAPKTHGPKRWSQTWSQTMVPNGMVPNSGQQQLFGTMGPPIECLGPTIWDQRVWDHGLAYGFAAHAPKTRMVLNWSPTRWSQTVVPNTKQAGRTQLVMVVGPKHPWSETLFL